MNGLVDGEWVCQWGMLDLGGGAWVRWRMGWGTGGWWTSRQHLGRNTGEQVGG